MGELTPKTRVVGYIRVSTEEQSSTGVSLAAQSVKVSQYAQLHDLELIEVIEDAGVSAKSLDRPGLMRALGLLDSGVIEGIVVAKLDRLTRSVGDLDKLITWYFSDSAGRQLFSVADSIDTRTAAGRMVLNILMSVAQWERETIVERTREAFRHKRSLGERLGTVPYGFAVAPDGRTLVPEMSEVLKVGRMKFLRDAGHTFAAVAELLDAEGLATRTGRPWAPSTICQVLKNQPFFHAQPGATTNHEGQRADVPPGGSDLQDQIQELELPLGGEAQRPLPGSELPGDPLQDGTSLFPAWPQVDALRGDEPV